MNSYIFWSNAGAVYFDSRSYAGDVSGLHYYGNCSASRIAICTGFVAVSSKRRPMQKTMCPQESDVKPSVSRSRWMPRLLAAFGFSILSLPAIAFVHSLNRTAAAKNAYEKSAASFNSI